MKTKRLLPARYVLSGLCGACLFMAASHAVEPAAEESETAAAWRRERLESGDTGNLPFSFRYGGRPSREMLADWRIERTERSADERRVERAMTWTDPGTGLAVRCIVTAYHDSPALEWVLHFKNTGGVDTPILEDVQALDTSITAAVTERTFTVHYAEGSHERITDFRPWQKPLALGDELRLASFGGRSSDGVLPLFNLATPGNGGVAIGIGWTGQWSASFSRPVRESVHLRAGMETTHLLLRPGEEIRTPAVLLLFWSGPDRMRGQNLLRRLLLQHYTPRIEGKPADPPCAASPHAVVKFEGTNQANMIQAIENLASHSVVPDYFWIDTGWFTCHDHWARHVGNFAPDPVRFPGGMRPVADVAHRAGMKFLLWFEPERVMPGTWLFENHPEWLLQPADDMPAELRYQINDRFHLLDLGNPAALSWLRQRISGMVRAERIDCYRNDFNMYPAYYWCNGESRDRQGIREIRYITGLYSFFDALKQDHPHLLLDTCASGGRRIDFEMLRRALVLTRSDYLWDPIGQQCHTYGLSQWIPVTGIGAASLDIYNCRSGLGSHFALAADFYSQDPAVWQAISRTVQEYRSVKHIYTGDFYPLAPYSTASDAWMAWQYHRPDLGEGLVQAFRRQDSPVERAAYRLCGLEADAEYSVTNRDGGRPMLRTGQQLSEQGLEIRLPDRAQAAIFVYRKMDVSPMKAQPLMHRHEPEWQGYHDQALDADGTP